MPTPNFHDLSDGSSIINYAGHDFDDLDIIFDDPTPAPPPQPCPPTEINSSPNLNVGIGASQVAINPNRRTEARMYSQGTAPHVSPPPRRRSPRSPNDIVRKDPNAWSLREAVELCKLLEVVLPEAGFHIALTGGLLYKEGRRKDCDLMFYQIRQVEPNYEVLWKYLTVAGVIRSPSYPENGWLVKATYRGKLIDCLFPNAKKVKKAGAPNPDCYKAAPAPPAPHAVGEQNTAFGAQSLASNNAGTCNTEIGSALVRHNDGDPILYRRSPSAPPPYDPAELLATPAPAPVPPRPPSETTVEAARTLGISVREYERQFE